MKKISIITCIMFFLSSIALNAQADKNKKKTEKSSSNASTGNGCFNESSKILNIGIGIGGRGYYNYNNGYRGSKYRSSPSFGISYEQALKEKIGPGFIGIGAYLGYQSAYWQYDYDYKNNNNYYYYKHKWKYMFFAARAAYHLDALNFEKGELYFGALLGLRYTSYSFETNDIDPNKDSYRLKNSSLWPSYSGFIGGRYYLASKIAVYGEIGWMSWLTVGASFKF
ncbi:MAG: hypothetical protein Q7W45_05125 [Bacteroidota bacterium]|nr:hypothetical protein [Bacteroidota bacterium]MDP3144829.1 hypothetical protein [Bacteroidota bacterium]MDP3557800.1 hypothetical protein [Bacteroidota bacterium]